MKTIEFTKAFAYSPNGYDVVQYRAGDLVDADDSLSDVALAGDDPAAKATTPKALKAALAAHADAVKAAEAAEAAVIEAEQRLDDARVAAIEARSHVRLLPAVYVVQTSAAADAQESVEQAAPGA